MYNGSTCYLLFLLFLLFTLYSLRLDVARLSFTTTRITSRAVAGTTSAPATSDNNRHARVPVASVACLLKRFSHAAVTAIFRSVSLRPTWRLRPVGRTAHNVHNQHRRRRRLPEWPTRPPRGTTASLPSSPTPPHPQHSSGSRRGHIPWSWKMRSQRPVSSERSSRSTSGCFGTRTRRYADGPPRKNSSRSASARMPHPPLHHRAEAPESG